MSLERSTNSEDGPGFYACGPAAPRLAEPGPEDWKPFPGPQERFLSLRTFEGLYGGAAGGGKSDALLIDAVRYVGKGYGSHYKALLLRRTFADLEKSLIDRSRELYPRLGGVYNEQKRYWRFPGGEKIYFGYLERDASRLQYQGAAFCFVGFDELTHFSLIQYLYLFSRCRSAFGVPCRIRGATNPGGPGHDWVFERFGPWLDPKHPQPAPPGQVRYFLPKEEGGEEQVERGTLRRVKAGRIFEELEALGRVFVPAKLDDNPALLADLTYRAGLAQLDPVTREQLRNGNWLIKPSAGLYFKRKWVTFVDAAPPGLVWVRAWDFAGTEVCEENKNPDWTVGVKMARWGDRFIVGHVVRARLNEAGVEELLESTAEADGTAVEQIIPKDPGAAGKNMTAVYQRLLAGFPVRVVSISGDKITRFKPFSGQASPPACNIVVVRGAWTDAWLDELETFPGPGKKDQVDATGDAFNALTGRTVQEPNDDDYFDFDDDRDL